MTVWLVRHGSAGSRKAWVGPDQDRPLDSKGRRQAERLAQLLKTVPARSVRSSPYLRCIETVAPLAGALGVQVDVCAELAEGHELDAIAVLRSHARDDVVLCTHGDIVPALLEWMGAEGGRVPRRARWSKGSTWVLDAKRGRFTTARYLPPPS
jgi:8-oxo-dGTP diphosphatase